MEKLIAAMKRALADTFAMSLKGAYYHWNVVGPDFFQYHGLFGELYAEIYGAVDPMAEHIRALGSYTPGSLGRFSELTTIEDENTIPPAIEMVTRYLNDNNKVIASLTEAQRLADSMGKVGVSNFLQDRIDIHEKHAWMLRATTTTQ